MRFGSEEEKEGEEEEEEGGHAAFEGRPPGEVAAAKCCPRRPRGPCSTARHTAGLAGTAAGVPRAHGHSLATAALAAGAGPSCNQIYACQWCCRPDAAAARPLFPLTGGEFRWGWHWRDPRVSPTITTGNHCETCAYCRRCL
ncbi:unnamed protein product [Prorocentrum cordatum]|uniref:Uncharacterized protein n=1 Tax=Prorocentrum cordatum TaxID=2364126 RepID=A0ABN9S4E0_9DINO|nr:unnamed protein product [Polarella glacialis]